jgi:hypothetical protein
VLTGIYVFQYPQNKLERESVVVEFAEAIDVMATRRRAVNKLINIWETMIYHVSSAIGSDGDIEFFDTEFYFRKIILSCQINMWTCNSNISIYGTMLLDMTVYVCSSYAEIYYLQRAAQKLFC